MDAGRDSSGAIALLALKPLDDKNRFCRASRRGWQFR
jgi:hypothetical protein